MRPKKLARIGEGPSTSGESEPTLVRVPEAVGMAEDALAVGMTEAAATTVDLLLFEPKNKNTMMLMMMEEERFDDDDDDENEKRRTKKSVHRAKNVVNGEDRVEEEVVPVEVVAVETIVMRKNRHWKRKRGRMPPWLSKKIRRQRPRDMKKCWYDESLVDAMVAAAPREDR